MVRVAFQGERGAYGEMAALQYFPKAKLVPLKSFQDVFDAARNGKVHYAVVPIENSIEGSVNEIYDLLLQTEMSVIGEVYQRVRHCLIANRGVKITAIKYVYSHPQALAQCRSYIQRKKLESVPAYDTAGSVKLIKEEKIMNAAAIASKRAAELYNMDILEEGIEDRKNNFTRFFVLSPKKSNTVLQQRKNKAGSRKERTGTAATTTVTIAATCLPLISHGGSRHHHYYKTSMIFSIKHVPGALYGILGEFAIRKINLTKIESRPTKETPWEYNFYVDFEGHIREKAVQEALESVKAKTSYIKILGSYRKADFH